MRHKILSITQRFRLPAICALCNQYHQGNLAVCTECQKYLTPIKYACKHCALPLLDNIFLICGHCIKNKPNVDLVIAANRFEEPLRSLIHEFKYNEGLYLSSFFTSLILQAIPTEAKTTECLIPVPLHHKRLRKRGFNQAALLTKQLGQALKLPYNLTYCTKIINTATQASLNAKHRKANLKNSFLVKSNKYKHVTLIDDLLTTGSTVNELAKTLKQQGVSRVDVWCCARA